MRSLRYKLLLLLISSVLATAQGQVRTHQRYDPAFKKLVDEYEGSNPFDTLKLPVLYGDDQFTVAIADTAWRLPKRRLSLRSPAVVRRGKDKFPLAYSVLYQNRLVSLFNPGTFACYVPGSWKRDKTLERQLNTNRCRRHWLIDGQLVAQVDSTSYWQFRPQSGWQPYAAPVPFGSQPKLYEDDTYLVWATCQGEFGGHVFFYNRQTRQTHFTAATCAIWVRHTPQGYEVLSSLSSSRLRSISDPRTLPVWQPGDMLPRDLDYFNQETTASTDLHEHIFGGFEWKGQLVYVVAQTPTPCLATLSGKRLTLVDPFPSNFFTHKSVTTEYPKATLVNLDFYGTGGDREVRCLFVQNNALTMLEWR